MDSLIFRLLITLAIGAVGAFALYKLKVPAGSLLGAAIAVSVFNVFSGAAFFPRAARVAVQAVAGAFVGQKIGRKDLLGFKSLIVPSLIVFFGICVLSLSTGFTIYLTSDNVGIATALLSSAPGGVTDIALISSDVGADPAQSTVLQLIRYMVAIMILPQVNSYICRRFAPAREPAGSSLELTAESSGGTASAVITLSIALIAGLIGRVVRFPAGAIVFSMFAVAAYNIKSGKAYVPRKLKLVAQWLAGVSIGVSVTMADVLGLRYLVLPAVFVLINCLLINYGLGFLIYKTTDLDLATCLFSTVPAGVSDMALISLEQGGDAPKVAILQMSRYICIMVLMPSLIKFISSLL